MARSRPGGANATAAASAGAWAVPVAVAAAAAIEEVVTRLQPGLAPVSWPEAMRT